MAETQKSGFFGRLKRSVGLASTGGMIGYAASILFFIPIPQTIVVVAGLVGGALVAKATSKKQ